MVYFCFILIQKFSGNKSVLGYRLFSVATGSMRGVYEINDIIAVKDCDTNSLVVGDDIAYKGEVDGFKGLLITHRIIKIEKDDSGKKIYYTKGVNSSVVDPSITDRQILGKVVGVVPIVTQFNHIVNNQLYFFLFIFLPIVLMILFEVFKTIKEIISEKKKITLEEKNSEQLDNYNEPVMIIKDINEVDKNQDVDII